MRRQFGQNEARGLMRIKLHKIILKQALLQGSEFWVLSQQNENIYKERKRTF
jgi:hypothetical protein